MLISFFGRYDPSYSRNIVLLKGLKENQVEVIHCNSRVGILPLRWLMLSYLFFRNKAYSCNFIFVGFPGHTDVPLAFILGKLVGKKVIFDAFFSLYNSAVFDRQYFPASHWHAKYYYLVDKLACQLADKVILDTKAHCRYFARTFKIPLNKFITAYVGTDTSLFSPRTKKSKEVVIGFHGSYLPLQGIDVIIKAAKKLPKLKFHLVGDGLKFQSIKELAERLNVLNVTFSTRIPYKKLPLFIASTTIYIPGPFGTNSKAGMVIPNKVYESAAMRKAMIVGDSQATRELFTHKKDAYFITRGNPNELVKAIRLLLTNSTLRETIAAGGYKLIKTKLTPKLIVRNLLNDLEK